MIHLNEMTTKELQPYQQTVIEEYNDLQDRMSKLKDYIKNNPEYKSLPADERGALIILRGAMENYEYILKVIVDKFLEK